MRPEAVGCAESATLLRAYFAELIVRYNGRETTDAEVDEVLAEFPNTDLAPPTGLFLVLRNGSAAAGCVGLRVLAPCTLELTRLYVRPAARRGGAGRALLAAAEREARRWGAKVIRLDTRADLVEARRLYARSGYAEIPAYNTDPYAGHWFEKRLS